MRTMKPGRNDPCPCGSGKKYKKCCGATIPIAAIAPDPVTPTGRKCGECTTCCGGWVAGNMLGHEVKPGSPCPFVRADGCSVYERRPTNPCKNFVCGWLLPDSPLWGLPNVLVCPHSASTVHAENGRITDIFCHNLRCYLDGRLADMRNVLDKKRMY